VALMGPVYALAQKITPRQEKKAAAPIVHYFFGTAVGAAFGVAVETTSAVRTGLGHCSAPPFGWTPT
jgi:hypothetical protein